MLRLFVLILLLVVPLAAAAQTAPNWVIPDASTGGHPFYTTAPDDQSTGGAHRVQVITDTSAASCSFWRYIGTTWTKIAPKYFTVSATVTDSMLTIPASSAAEFEFPQGCDLIYIYTSGSPDVWGE